MNILKNINGKNHWLTLVFASTLLVILSTSTNEVFAMGPQSCNNEYDGPFVSFLINNGTQTFDALTNPGVTFNVNGHGSYNLTFVIHTPSTSSQNNTLPGSAWYHVDAGVSEAVCTGTVGPNQNVTVSMNNITMDSQLRSNPQGVDFDTRAPSQVYYYVNWITAPSSPQNLQATTVSPSQINLSWTVPSNKGGYAITGYMIERSTDGGSTWSTIVSNTGNTTTSYSDTGLASGISYTYRVSAINNIGTGNPSNTASASTPSITFSAHWTDCCFGNLEVIGSVQNPISGINQMQLLIYAPNGVLVLNQTKSTAGFQSDYGISRSEGKGNYTIIGTYDNSLSTKTEIPSWINNDPAVGIEAVEEGNDGSVEIIGYVQNGIGGEQISIGILDSTNSTTATYTVATNTQAEFDFGIDSKSATHAFPNSGNFTIIVTHIPTGIKGEKILEYAVPPPPQPPTNLSATTSSSSQINLSWTAPANNGGPPITGYVIERSIDNGNTWSTIVSNTGNTGTTYSNTGLAHSTTYTYRVSTINDFGTGQPSSTASATTFNTVPSVPTGLTAAAQTLQINLSWNAPSDNGGTPITGYEVERSTNNGSTWSTIVSNTGNTGTTYSDKNVLPLTTYTYRVSAINNIGIGSPSNTASASTPSVSIPSAPTLP